MTTKTRLLTFLLPTEGLCTDREMYFRDKGRNCGWDAHSISIPAGGRISFSTYFNSFDYGMFRRSTTVDEVFITLSLQGSLHVSVVQCYREESGSAATNLTHKNVVYETDFSSEEKRELTVSVDLTKLNDRGILYVRLSSDTGGKYFGGHVDATKPPRREHIKIGIAFTTFKREEFVKKNVRILTEELPQDYFGVFVVDNGHTLAPSDVPGATLLPNKNLGGSGGFARGIMEIIKRNSEYTHVLLCDDDIRFHSEIFSRTLAILRYAKAPDKIIIGASMLNLNKHYIQHELGSKWYGNYIRSLRNNADVREIGSLLGNIDGERADYTAWWFNCFSIAIPYKVGLPFPFFIKIDDVEYCIRADCDYILTNGIGVWHEPFENKFAAELEYYAKRNELILNALHYPQYGRWFHFVKLFRALTKQVIYQRYFVVDLIFKAYDDFLRGASYFEKIKADELHRELRSVGEKQHTIEELEEMGYDVSKHQLFNLSDKDLSRKVHFEQVVTLNGYLLPKWTYNKNERRTFRLVSMYEPHTKSFFRAYRVVHYNPETKMAFVTKQSRWKVLQTALRLLIMFFKILVKFGHARASFKRKLSSLTSFEAWEKRLDIINE